MAEDFVRTETSFANLEAGVNAAIAILEAEFETFVAQGDEIRAQAKRLQIEALSEGAGGRTPAVIEQASVAITRENALKQTGADIDLASLDILKAQTQQRKEQIALTEALQTTGATPGGLTIPHERRYTSASQLAGSQVEAEAAQRQLTQLAAEENARKQLGLGIDRETLDVIEQEVFATRQLIELSARQGAAPGSLDNTAIERANALRQLGLRIDQETLGVLQATAEEHERIVALEAEEARFQQLVAERTVSAYATGHAAGSAGGLVSSSKRTELALPPAGVNAAAWAAATQQALRLNTAIGEYDGLATRAGLSTEHLNANLTRLGIADAEASTQLRKHGALTTEFLGALARGETTVSEFGYQIGATIGKFAGWTAAAAATYGALGAVVEFGKGAIDTASAVQQLTRTIDNLDREKASTALQNLSAEVNVPIKEAGDAVFAFSRTFHTLDGAITGAKLALAAFKLDGVSVTDSVKAATAISQQYGLSAHDLIPVFDQLAQGQQKFNARISDQIPLLQRSAGAIKNAGGGLQEFIQLSTYALRTTQLSGAQVGTIFQRAASNYLNPATTKGGTDIETLRSLGVKVDTTDVVKTIENAITRSASLTNEQRAQLTIAIGGQGYGGRAAALFGGDVALQREIAQKESPANSKGVLQTELDKELGTAKQQLESFVNELQRFGAALAESGVVTVLTSMVGGFVSVADEGRKLINLFDSLPSGVKNTVEALLALRLAMLFVSRTRFGGSVPLINRVPGFAPDEETKTRQALALGTRNALQLVDKDIEATINQTTANAQEQDRLKIRQLAIEKEIQAAGVGTAAQYEASNAVSEKIVGLQKKGLDLEEENNTLVAQQARLIEQRNGLTASRLSSQRYTGAQVSTLRDQVNATGASAVADEAASSGAGIGAYATQRAAVARRALGAKLSQLSTATRSLVGAEAASTAAAEEATFVSASAGTAALTAGAAFASTGAAVKGLGTKLGTMIAGLDPLLIGLLAAPLAYSAIKSAIDDANKSADKTLAANKQAYPSLAALQAAADKGVKATAGPYTTGNLIHDFNPFRESEDSYNARQQAAEGFQALANAHANAALESFSSPVGQVDQTLSDLKKQTEEESRAFEQHRLTKEQYVAAVARLKRSIQYSLDVNTAPSAKQANTLEAQATAQLDARVKAAYLSRQETGTGPLQDIRNLTAKQAEELISYLDDYSKVFGGDGQGNDALVRAASAYAQLANKYIGSTNSADLQKVAEAQSSFVGVVNKNASDLLAAADTAQTSRGESSDINQSIGSIRTAMAVATAQFTAQLFADGADAKKIAGTLAAQRAVLNQFAAQLASGIQAQLSQIAAQGALQTSTIGGTSPESGIARDQSNLANLQKQLAAAKAGGAGARTIQGLQQQINDANNTLANDQLSNANAISAAQGQLAVSSIQGTGPAADIARARQAVANAQLALNRAKSQHAGQAAILSAQAALDDANNTLFSTMQSQDQTLAQNLAAFIQSEADLAEANTLSPVKAAQDQVAADIKEAATIQRKNYQSEKDYLTALNEANAKTAKDRQSVRDAIVQQDLNTLAFENATQKIGDQQYINGLEQILKTKKLALAERQQIEEQIYNLQQGLGKSLDLNVGNLKLPSVYQIRRAIGLGTQGELPGAQNTVINHTATVNVYVNGHKGAHAVGAAIDKSLGTSVKAAMRARGV